MRRVLLLLAHGLTVADAAMASGPNIGELSRRARAVHDTWVAPFTPPGASSKQASVRGDGDGEARLKLAFDSAYTEGASMRGGPGCKSRSWANWLVNDRLMLGQYPHCQPAVPGPDEEAARTHLRRVLEAGIDCFVQLQAELPPQGNAAAWPADGVRLADAKDVARWPAPFVRYAADVDRIAESMDDAPSAISYLHCPIVDLSVPTDGLGAGSSLLTLLDEMLTHYEGGGRAIYVHCWGGRGRTGLVGACLYSLMRPDLNGDAVLSLVQAAYDSRSGADTMPSELKRSPQTPAQRQFVQSFVRAVRAARRYDNDLEMKANGMPGGFM